MTQAEKSKAAIAKLEEKLEAAKARQKEREAKAERKAEEAEPKLRIALHQLQVRCWKTGLTGVAQDIVAGWGEEPEPIRPTKTSKTKK